CTSWGRTTAYRMATSSISVSTFDCLSRLPYLDAQFPHTYQGARSWVTCYGVSPHLSFFQCCSLFHLLPSAKLQVPSVEK
ncbi:MAG: hypothetical protein OEM41_11005, partial [Ignavibacteria bacterium]|nr:hypothetical protein [Ignavibacteria bacterium]